MKLRLLSASIALTALFAGCAEYSKSELTQLRHSGVSPTLVDKFEQGRILTPPDIIELAHHRVADELIVRQIEDASVDYVLTRNDLKQLESAHVSRAVMDALIHESNDFAADHAPPGPPHAFIASPEYPAYNYYDYYAGYPYYYGYPYGGVVVGVGGGRYYGHHHRHW